MKKQLLIDGDMLLYLIGFASQKTSYLINSKIFKYKKEAIKECQSSKISQASIRTVVEADPLNFATHSMMKTLNRIFKACNSTDYRLFLSGKDNFRDALVDYYKANRVDAEKPYHYNDLKDYLVQVWLAEVVNGWEADDALSMNANEKTIIVTADKDLNTVAGWHYNHIKDVLYNVSEEDAITWFYCQMLLGDTVDNIAGVKFYGPIKVFKAFKDIYGDEKELFMATKKIYQKRYGEDEGMDKLIETGRLLYMLREPNVMWEPPCE